VKIRIISEIFPIKLANINTFIYLCTVFMSRSIDIEKIFRKMLGGLQISSYLCNAYKTMVNHPVRASVIAQSSRLGIFMPSSEHHRRLPFA